MGKNYEELKPVMSLKAKVVHIKKANKGEYIGYGKTYRVDKESYIATYPSLIYFILLSSK